MLFVFGCRCIGGRDTIANKVTADSVKSNINIIQMSHGHWQLVDTSLMIKLLKKSRRYIS